MISTWFSIVETTSWCLRWLRPKENPKPQSLVSSFRKISRNTDTVELCFTMCNGYKLIFGDSYIHQGTCIQTYPNLLGAEVSIKKDLEAGVFCCHKTARFSGFRDCNRPNLPIGVTTPGLYPIRTHGSTWPPTAFTMHIPQLQIPAYA